MTKKTAFFFCALCILLGAPVAHAQEAIEVSYPMKRWAVKVNAPGFVVKTNQTTPDLRQSLMAISPSTGMVLSVTLEHAAKADTQTCPAFLQQRVAGLTGFGLSDARYSTAGSMSVVEYMLAGTPEMPLRQKNWVACTAKEDIYVDIHFSKDQFQSGQEALFTALLEKITFGPVGGADNDGFTPASPGFTLAAKQESSRTILAIASRYYLQQQYSQAITEYERALAMEKQQPSLDKNLWRVLVDNLGMAYGMTADLANAERVFQYGLSKDPDYPMFSYNMACIYGEKRDLDNAVMWLKRTLANKPNLSPGEKLPDPHKDDSFHNFLGKPKFEEAVGGWK